jgi:hypothetical protein
VRCRAGTCTSRNRWRDVPRCHSLSR